MANDGEMKGDKLVLRGLKFHGYHGVKEEEKKLGQKFVIDIDAWMDLHQLVYLTACRIQSVILLSIGEDASLACLM